MPSQAWHIEAMSSATPTQRVLLHPAYLLHHRPYRDTSRILDLYTREHGRITVFARGARSAKSALSPVLQPFNRLLVSWTVGRDAGQLIGAEFDGAPLSLPPARLMSGFYVNELLLKLLTGHDAHPVLFDWYAVTVESLKGEDAEGRTLRIFEKRLLQELGYGLSLTHEAEGGHAIQAERQYRYVFEHGPVPVSEVVDAESHPSYYSGASLLSLAREILDDPVSRNDARRLLRGALERLLDGRGLNSREILGQLRRLSREPS